MPDVTDANFASAVLERSNDVPIVVDLWAPWCGPCKQLTPLLEAAVAGTGGKVELAKVNVDDNPQVAQMFRVQSIPAVYAVKDGQVVDGFVGAQGQAGVEEFIARLLPTETDAALDALVGAGDEASLRQALELDAGHEPAVLALAELLIGSGQADEALSLLERVPDNDDKRRLAALARTGEADGAEIEAKLDDLLARVGDDEAARQQFVDLLELLGAAHPRTAEYRRKLSSALY